MFNSIKLTLIQEKIKDIILNLQRLGERNSSESKVQALTFLLNLITDPEQFATGFDLHLVDKMPDKLSKYKNSLILENGHLHYVTENKTTIPIPLSNPKLLEKNISLQDKKSYVKLSNAAVHRLIRQNGGAKIDECFTDVFQKYFRNQDPITIESIIDTFLQDNTRFKKGKQPASIADVLSEQRALIASNQTTTMQSLYQLKNDFSEVELDLPSNKEKRQAAIEFTETVIIGDSLTDAWEISSDSLMSDWSGILGVSPKGSFTNEYTWSDMLHFKYAMQTIRTADKDYYNGLTAKDKKKRELFYDSLINLDQNSQEFKVLNQVISRIYAIGGLTAKNVVGTLGNDLMHTLIRLALSNIEAKRKILMSDDQKAGLSKAEISKKLYIIWAGANDLVTIDEPSHQAAEDAVQAIMENVEALIQHGAKHFVLLNLPDISLVPRYKTASEQDQKKASSVVNYYNQYFAASLKHLQQKYPQCAIDAFDIFTPHQEYAKHSEAYGFKADYTLVDETNNNYNFNAEKISHSELNVIHYKRNYTALDELNNITYVAVDPCNQKQKGSITIEELNIAKKRNTVENYIKDQLKTSKIFDNPRALKVELKNRMDALNDAAIDDFKIPGEKKSPAQEAEFERLMLDILRRRGHILDSVFTPIKNTIAFETYKAKLIKEGKAMTELPGENQLHYDILHPSSKLFKLLFDDHLGPFIDKKYRFMPPAVTLPNGSSQPFLDLKAPANKEQEKQPKLTETQLINQFIRHYNDAFREQSKRFLHSFFIKKGFDLNAISSVQDILDHADEANNRTRAVIKKLGWIDEAGNVTGDAKEYKPCLSRAGGNPSIQ